MATRGHRTGLPLPAALALARAARDVPTEPGWSVEAKADGYRGLVVPGVDLVQSRSGANLAARFPEVLNAVRALGDVALDGELVAERRGRLEFSALRFGPARRAREGVEVRFWVFDVLVDAGEDVRAEPYHRRRGRLEVLLSSVDPPLRLTPATRDRAAALSWMEPHWPAFGIEGVVCKRVDDPYRAGRTGSWLKVRQRVVGDVAVIGVTGAATSPSAAVLGPLAAGELAAADAPTRRMVGLSAPLSPTVRHELAARVRPAGPPQPLPAAVGGFARHGDAVYLPVHPVVVEIEADPVLEFGRWRHRPRVRHIRPAER